MRIKCMAAIDKRRKKHSAGMCDRHGARPILNLPPPHPGIYKAVLVSSSPLTIVPPSPIFSLSRRLCPSFYFRNLMQSRLMFHFRVFSSRAFPFLFLSSPCKLRLHRGLALLQPICTCEGYLSKVITGVHTMGMEETPDHDTALHSLVWQYSFLYILSNAHTERHRALML